MRPTPLVLTFAMISLFTACETPEEVCAQFWCETDLEADISPNLEGEGTFTLEVTLGGSTSSCSVTFPGDTEATCTQGTLFELRLDVDGSAGALTAFGINTQDQVPNANPTAVLRLDDTILFDDALDVSWTDLPPRPEDCGGVCRAAVWSGALGPE